MNEKGVLTKKERQNHVAFLGIILASAVYTMVFITEYVIGGKPIWYSVIGCALSISLPVMATVFWKKDHETDMIRHVVAVGFAVIYTYSIFTASSSLTYVYAFPMLLIVCVYGDLRYMVKIIAGLAIENLIVAIAGIVTQSAFGFVSMDSSIIQIISVCVMAVAAFFVMRALEINNRNEVESVAEEKEKSDKLLHQVTEISDMLNEGIEEITTATVALKDAAEKTQLAMSQVADGAGETSDAVQQQMLQTEEIQNKIEKISEEAGSVSAGMGETLKVLNAGKEEINGLVQKVEDSVNLGVDVTEKLETLDEYIEKMHTIVGIISGITSQTSLLALNASIEAARAGEAGKGFAVVAGEISGMATQTKDATVNITELIDGVSTAISQVVSIVREMIDGINGEREAANSTVESFGEIEHNTIEIQQNIVSLTDGVQELEVANREIAEYITKISAISQELTARANETHEAELANMEHINNISDKAVELKEISSQ